MITRNLTTARAAYAGGDPAASRRAHEQATERHQQAHGQYVKSISTRSEQEYARTERAREQWEVEHYPEGEGRELEELYAAKGMDAADARTVVGLIAKNKKVWVDVMMVEELGIVRNEASPLKNALKTHVTMRPWLRSGLEMLGVGGVAAAAAYAIGCGLSCLQ